MDDQEKATEAKRKENYIQWKKVSGCGKNICWLNRPPRRMDPKGTRESYSLNAKGEIVLTTTDRDDPTIAMWNCPGCKISIPAWSPNCEAKGCKGMNPDTVRTLSMKAYLKKQKEMINKSGAVPWFVKHSLDKYLAAKRVGKTAHATSGRAGYAQWHLAPSAVVEVRKRKE